MREIGATDASIEEDVAAHEERVTFDQETKAVRRVTRNVKDFDRKLRQIELGFPFEEVINLIRVEVARHA